MKIGDWLHAATQRLTPILSDEAGLSAQVVLAAMLGRPRAWLLTHPEHILSDDHQDQLRSTLDRLAQGVPLPYITGQQEFFGLGFTVTPDVLIPRPETELLVEHALAWLSRHPGRRAADAGTGSGAIAVSLAVYQPDAILTAIDVSMEALRVARRNAAAHHVLHRVQLLQSDLLSATAGPFDLVCANLPYIPAQTLADLPVARHEPRLALDGGPDGLRLIESLLAGARRCMATGGALLLEIESGQGESAPRLAAQYFPGAAVACVRDLAGLPRLLTVQL